MPVLKNAKHEAFAQGLAKGLSASEAYVAAGYKESRSAASRLSANVNIQKRVEEIVQKVSERLIEKTAITKERVAEELAKIAFLDIREAVRWGKSPLDTTSENASPNGLGIYPVELVPSEIISDDAAAAVSEVSLTQTGVKIKMHDKRAALMDLAKLMGFVTDKHEHTGRDGGPIETKDVSAEALIDEAKRLGIPVEALGLAGVPAKE